MKQQIARTICVCLVLGCALHGLQFVTSGTYLTSFFQTNLINLLAALLAINCATVGIVLTKIRELVDRSKTRPDFERTRAQMLLSIHEQLALLAGAVILLTVRGTTSDIGVVALFILDVGLAGIFIYAGHVLYDVATSVFIVLDFEVD